jgi:hypothetical protein
LDREEIDGGETKKIREGTFLKINFVFLCQGERMCGLEMSDNGIVKRIACPSCRGGEDRDEEFGARRGGCGRGGSGWCEGEESVPDGVNEMGSEEGGGVGREVVSVEGRPQDQSSWRGGVRRLSRELAHTRLPINLRDSFTADTGCCRWIGREITVYPIPLSSFRLRVRLPRKDIVSGSLWFQLLRLLVLLLEEMSLVKDERWREWGDILKITII